MAKLDIKWIAPIKQMDVDQTYQTETSSGDESSDDDEHLDEVKRSLFKAWGIKDEDHDSDEGVSKGESTNSEEDSDSDESVSKDESVQLEEANDVYKDPDEDVSIVESTKSEDTDVHSNVLLGQFSTEENDTIIESSEEQKYKVTNVFSGSDYDSFAFLPWQIHSDESSKAHSWLRKEISECLSGELSLSRVFSPFYNRSFHLLDGFLVKNDFYWDSFEHVVGINKSWLLNSAEAMYFIAYFVNDFVLDYAKNCVKHKLLHSGKTLDEVRVHMNDGNHQIPHMVEMLCADIERGDIDQDAESRFLQVSRFRFEYNSVRKIMKQLVDIHMKKKPDVYRGMDDKVPLTISLVYGKRENLLSIFYFAYHHYSLFREEYVELLKMKHILLPQLMCEQMGKMLVVQRLVYPDIKYRGVWLSGLDSYDEGTYTSHFFCPFALHPVLKNFHFVWYEDDDYSLNDITVRSKVYIMEDLISLSHSFELMYWHDCYFTIKNMSKEDNERRKHKERMMMFQENHMVEEENEECADTGEKEGSERVDDVENDDPYYTFFGESKTPGFYDGKHCMYVMQYNVNCLSMTEKVKDLHEFRISEIDYQYCDSL